MIKLRQIITQLDSNTFSQLESALTENRAGNFLHLLRTYRTKEPSDADLMTELGITANSLYVLKSRLNERIQEALTGDIFDKRENVLQQLHSVPAMLYSGPPELAETILLKLEKDLLAFDMHNELLIVYSALKKIHLHSPKYFQYSQAFNRHAAFGLALEKCEELLGNFNRVMAEYDFSRSPAILDTLQFLAKDIRLHWQLNPSRQTELIRNLAELQMSLFTSAKPTEQFNAETVLRDNEKLLNELPANSPYKHWSVVLDMLYFEYYRQGKNPGAAMQYYDKVNSSSQNLLLYSGVCPAAKFFQNKLSFAGLDSLKDEDEIPVYVNEDDTYSQVLLQLYRATKMHLANRTKEAARMLNGVLNMASFKDMVHISVEIRLSLAFMYMQMEETELAAQLLKSVSRKLKAEDGERYPQIPHIVKVLGNDGKQSKKTKIQDEFTLFMARNSGDHAVLTHLTPVLIQKYMN